MTDVSDVSDGLDPTSIIGATLPPARVVIERGPVSAFATALTDGNQVYHDAEFASDAGFDAIPAPPTYGFAMRAWGAFPEIQPDGHDTPSPMMSLIGNLMSQGGLVLHGEEEFIYHRPIVVGDTLTATGRITDAYVKEGGSTMTFIVGETLYHDDRDELVLTERTTLLHKA
ncbi:MAG TPA: MaoC family dehydratase N-terminal domain-containing protein [Nitriliruptorales bacterium]